MATSRITNVCTDPSGRAVVSVPVTARLVPGPGFRTSDSSEVASLVSTTSDSRTGAWSLTLERNLDITPAGSYYAVEEDKPALAGGPSVWAAQVGSRDATLAASLVSAPQPQADGFLTQTAGDARYGYLSIEAIVVSGPAAVADNVLPPGARIGVAAFLASAYVRVGTAPRGADLIVRVRRNGATLTTVTVRAGATSGQTAGVSTAVVPGDVLTYDVTQVGSLVAGSDIAVALAP